MSESIRDPIRSSLPAELGHRAARGTFGQSRYPSTAPTDAPEHADRFPLGALVAGTYEVREVIGSGALGQVVDAVDESLGRRVALKVSWTDDERLRSEARALAAFRRASLPTIHAFGSHRGVDFAVMERLYGVTMADQLRLSQDVGAPLPIHEVRECLQATADALSIIHDAGLCHLDIRPENILVTPDRRTVLMDFGLVVPELGLAEQARLIGTSAYVAPEARGLTDPGTARAADMYGLGVTTFELLTGQHPRAVDPRAVGRMDSLSPVPTVAQFRPDVPADLAELVDAMISLDPAHRPESADLVRRRMERPPRPSDRDRRLRVMVVDDSPFVTKTLARYVERAIERVELQVHHDAESVVEALRDWEPDVMLLDLQLPGMSGLELCMYMRGAGIAASCEVVSVSAKARNEDRELLRTLGIRHYLAKDERLEATLNELLNRLRRQRVE